MCLPLAQGFRHLMNVKIRVKVKVRVRGKDIENYII